jgi:hypothetical protein
MRYNLNGWTPIKHCTGKCRRTFHVLDIESNACLKIQCPARQYNLYYLNSHS